LILLDISLGNDNGLDLLRYLFKQKKNISVLVVTSFNDKYFVEEALYWGAKGYVLKERMHEELPIGIQTVLSGELFIGKGIA
jgi:DNA-binding NarL/FixJ family response regulator